MKKYWYRTEVECCVCCGREKKYRFRVFEEQYKGVYFKDYACEEHFI